MAEREPTLFGELIGQSSGPALVIGGGPSAARDLPELQRQGFAPNVRISANEHGFRQDLYTITHSVCLDPRHGEKHISMEDLLGHDVPIISPNFFADYRLPEWTLACNTGLAAIAVAVFMGCAPVVVVGIDFYRIHDRNAGTYFHDAGAVSNSNTKTPRNFETQVKALEQWIGRAPPVRSWGPLGGRYGRELSEPVRPVDVEALPQAKYRRHLPICIVQAHPHSAVRFKMARVDPGRVFPCSPNEARSLVMSKKAKLLEVRPGVAGDEIKLPRGLLQGPLPARPAVIKPTTPSPLLDLHGAPRR